MANEFIARKGIISLDSIQVTGSITATGGITISGSISSASFATSAATASSADNFFVRQNLTGSNVLATGTITAQTLVVQTVTSSIVYSSGSNIFGNQLTDTQRFTGSMFITGSTLNVNGGSICATGNTCFGGNTIIAGCLGIGTATVSANARLSVCGAIESMFDSVASEGGHLTLRGQSTYLYRWNIDNKADELRFFREDDATSANGCLALTITGARVACFANTVCAPQFMGGFVCGTGGLRMAGATTTWSTISFTPDNPGGGGAQCKTVLAARVDGCTGWGPQIRFSGATSGQFIDIGQDCNGGFVIEGTDNPRLTVTNCGSVGIGVIPKPWGSTYTGFQIGGYGALWANTGGSDMQMGSNAYYDGTNYRYIATDFASRYFQFSGNHIWSYVASGTTGCTFTFCEAMRITCNGVVGIKTTSTSTEGNLFLGANSTEEGGQLVLQKATNYSCATHLDNYANQFRILSGTDTGTTTVNLQINHTTGNTTINGAVYRYNGQTVVGGSFTNLTAIDVSSSRTYLISMIPTNIEATLSYRIFGVIQVNATSGTYAFTTLSSQTMDVTFSGSTVQARVTNGQQWTFNWSITQLL